MYVRKLVGTRCYLSPLDAADVERYVHWLNDPDVYATLQIASAVITMDGEKEALARLAKEHNYAVVDLATDAPIGIVGLMELEPIHRTAELGVTIGDKAYWNRGYAAEAITLLVRYAFDILNLHNIVLRVYEFNAAAIRCYEKVGFKHIGRRRGAVQRNRRTHDVVYMDIVPADLPPAITKS